MNSQCVHYVCCKSTSTRWKSGLRWNTCTHHVDNHVCLVFRIDCMHMWATVGHHYVYVDYYSKLPVTGCRPSDVQSIGGCHWRSDKKDTGYKRIFIFLRRGIVGKKKRVNCFLSLVLSILIQQFRAPPQNRAISHGCSCAECSTLLLLAVPIARS